MPPRRRREAAAKDDFRTRGQRARGGGKGTQPKNHITRHITRSIGKREPEEVVNPGGAGSFPKPPGPGDLGGPGDLRPRGKRAPRSAKASQPRSRITGRVTRSTGKREPEDLVHPGGTDSFAKERPGDSSASENSSSDNHQRDSLPATTGLAQERQVIEPAGAERTSTTPFEAHHIKDTIESGESVGFEENDYLWAFYRRVGYLPPIDNAVLDALERCLPEGMEPEIATGRISTSDIEKFEKGLAWRNVALKPDCENVDPQLEVLQNLKEDPRSATEEQDPRSAIEEKGPRPAPGSEKEVAAVVLTQYHELLWAGDMQKCRDQTQEAIFQRTLLMSMIDRLKLVYGEGAGSKPPPFDYAVETPWTCPPMPTKAARYLEYDAKWLTCPQPDLAIAFVRERLQFGKDFDWDTLPPATQKLICYEGESPEKSVRAFHFLTIEAKRVYKDIDDRVARSQCLNNASQALHNMYEVFREADEGTGHQIYTKMFFDKVRFFSIVATPKGMRIRLHRARDLKDSPSAITKGYPLCFTFTDYLDVIDKHFTYQRVAEELSNILLGYGVKVLQECLEQAIEAIHRKFQAYRDLNHKMIYRLETDYSHGSVPGPSRKRKTMSTSAAPTRESSRTPMPPPESLHLSQLQLDLDFAVNSGASTRSHSQTSLQTAPTSQQEGFRAKNKKRKPIG